MCTATSRRVSVTEAGSGLGVTRLFSRRGHQVIAGVLNRGQVGNLQREFGSVSCWVQVFQLDLTSLDEAERGGDPDTDVLVNNVGFGARGTISESPLKLVRRLFEVNLFCTLNLAQRVLAKLHKDDRPGRVMVVSYVAGILVGKGADAYSMSKRALDAMADEMQQETAGTQVYVYIVNPGPYATRFNEHLAENAPKSMPWVADQNYSRLLEGLDTRGLIDSLVDLTEGRNSFPRVILYPEFFDIFDEFQVAQLRR